MDVSGCTWRGLLEVFFQYILTTVGELLLPVRLHAVVCDMRDCQD